MNQQPIFIVGPHKSGTSLLRNLFDGHSELFVIPIEAHFFQHLGRWIDYGLRKQNPSDLSKDEIEQNLINWVIKSNTVSKRTCDSDTRNFWDISKFENKLIENIGEFDNLNIENTRKISESYILAMYHSLHNTELPANLRIVEKSVDNAEFAIVIKKIFPRAKFIHIIRNPYSNLVSIRKYKSEKKYPFLKPIIKSLYNNYYFLEKNSFVLGDDYLVIRYEDLVTESTSTVSEICKFLGLNTEEILYYPTVNGKIWEGNSTSNEKFEGISSSRLSKWKKEIYPLEIDIINSIFKYTLNKYNYEVIDGGNYLTPARKESVRTYLMNRLLYRAFL